MAYLYCENAISSEESLNKQVTRIVWLKRQGCRQVKLTIKSDTHAHTTNTA